MVDIWAGAAFVLALSVAMFWFVRSRTERARPRVRTALVLGATTLLCLSLFGMLDDLALARLFPFTNAVVLTNWVPLALAVLLGAAWWSLPDPAPTRVLIAGGMALGCLYFSYDFLLSAPPPCAEQWKDDVCIQTSSVSCSAAAAATILRYHGISATEAEMARLCLTGRMGTPKLGVYRGLKLKTRGTPWRVETFTGSAGDLRAGSGEPAILFVGLGLKGNADDRYEKQWGWRRGLKHAVVFFEFYEGDQIVMGDPSIGRERWSVDALDVLWRGQGLRLLRR